jgi:hypothetical protein
MAVSPKALASWGLLSGGEAGGGFTQVIREMDITVSVPDPLAVELEAEGISVALSEEE